MTLHEIMVWLNVAYIEFDRELCPSDFSVEIIDNGIRIRCKAKEIENSTERADEYTLAECESAIKAIESLRPEWEPHGFALVMLFEISIQIARGARSN